MRALNTKPMIILAALIAIAMTGCGKKNNEAAPGTPGYGGYPNGQYPQGNYPGGGAGGTLGSACTQITGPIQFSGGIYIDSANIYAGQQATAPSYGGYPQAGYGASQQISMYGSGSDGWMSIQATMTGQTSANAYGQLQLSPMVVQQIQYQMASSGLPYGQVPCASIVGINIGHYNTTLYGGGFGGGRAVLLSINGSIPYYVHF